jgi:hypothetical protein
VNLLFDERLARVRARLKSMRALEKQLLHLGGGILDELVSAVQGEA